MIPPHAHYKQGLQISTAQLHVSIFLDSVKLAVMEHAILDKNLLPFTI